MSVYPGPSTPVGGNPGFIMGILHRDLKNPLYLYKRNTMQGKLTERTMSVPPVPNDNGAVQFGEDRIPGQRVAIGEKSLRSVQLVRGHPSGPDMPDPYTLRHT